MKPSQEIDACRIVLPSKKIKIKDFSVFKIIIKGYNSQNSLIKQLKNTIIKKKYPKI